MTRKDAIEILKDLWRTKYSIYLEADIRKALEMAIQTLEQEPCEDAISREATLKPYKSLNDEDTISVRLIRKNIEQQQSVKPQKNIVNNGTMNITL